MSGPPGWNPIAAPWSVAIEEDALALEPSTWELARLDAGRPLLTLATSPHVHVAATSAELAQARRRLSTDLQRQGLAAAVAGTHPFTGGSDPMPGLRVRVTVPDPHGAVRALDGIRRQLPALLALSGNSPFRRGRDTGFASNRVALLSRRPRTGIPPAFHSFDAYMRVTAALRLLGRTPPAWDARLQPSTGALEVGVLDGQTRVADAAALAALLQCLVRMHADRLSPVPPATSAFLLDDNRLRAARDGMDAALAEHRGGSRRPVRLTLEHLVDACLPVADELGCVGELIDVTRLMTAPGAQRQRALAFTRHGARRSAALRAVVAGLHDEFVSSGERSPEQLAA